MKQEYRIKANFDTLDTYVSEHGKEYGTVSWQMAALAIRQLRDDIEEMQNYIELLKSERLEK